MVKSIEIVEHEHITLWSPEDINKDRPLDAQSKRLMGFDVEDLYQQAYIDGYRAAQQEFNQPSYNSPPEVISEIEGNLQLLFNELSKIKQELEQVIKNELIELCFNIVQHVCCTIFSENNEVIYHMIKKALSLMPQDNNILNIYISQQTYQMLMEYTDMQVETGDDIHFIIDEKLAPGDFFLDSAISSLDGTLAHRLSGLKQCL